MIHNHVDQELIPSQEDMDTTDRMIKVGEIIDLEVVEHEIIKIRKEAEQIGMEKGEKNKAIEMAQKMKKAGEPPDKISNYTGLPKEEIQKL